MTFGLFLRPNISLSKVCHRIFRSTRSVPSLCGRGLGWGRQAVHCLLFVDAKNKTARWWSPGHYRHYQRLKVLPWNNIDRSSHYNNGSLPLNKAWFGFVLVTLLNIVEASGDLPETTTVVCPASIARSKASIRAICRARCCSNLCIEVRRS